MTFCLDTKLIKPESGKEIKNIIVLLHGYGGDGNDIAQVTLNWKRFLPNTLFVCPNAPEKCLISPSAMVWSKQRQWWIHFEWEQKKWDNIKKILKWG